MASITRHDGRWRAHVFRHGIRATKVCDTKPEARAWALKKEAELDALSGSGARTLLSAINHYLNTVSAHKYEGATKWEKARFTAMSSYFGVEAKLANITTEKLSQWRDERRKTVSGSTIQREASLLRHLFTLAVEEWKWLDTNPFTGLRLPPAEEARKAVWSWQQIKRILRAGLRSGGKTGEVAKAFHIALRTSMRLQEVLVAPEHFNPVTRVVTLPNSKTSLKPEEVPIGRIAAKLLQGTKFTVGAHEAGVLFIRLRKQQMIEGLTFHDTRATALTHLAKKMDVFKLARVSRHKDINLLYRVYYRESAADIARLL